MKTTPAVKHKIVEDIFNRTQKDSTKSIHYIHKNSLRFLLSRFGSLNYIDGNGNSVKIKCYHANPERAIGIIFKEANIILPALSISENSTRSQEKIRRYEPILLDEKFWHPKYQRAVRIVSLTPRPITISYSIHIWSYYKNDLDQVREMIFSMFNPDLNISIDGGFYSKVFIESEDDASEVKVQDQEDRLLQKSINLTLETSFPAPKFLYTSTGKIEKFNFEFDYVTGKLTEDSLQSLNALIDSEIAESEINLGGTTGGTGGVSPNHTHEQYVTPEELQSMTWLTN